MTPQVVDEARIDQFYGEIERMVVTLDEEFTHQQYHRKTVLIRTHMDRLGTITSQISADLHRVSRHLLRLEKIFELERDTLLASDMGVRSERTQGAQLAKVSFILQDKIREIHLLTIQQDDLVRMMSLVKVKLQDLHNAQSSLRDQRKVFELIHASGRGLPAITESVTTMERGLDAMISSLGSPVSSLAPVEGFLEPPYMGGATAKTPTQSNTDSDNELDSILANIPSLEELTRKPKAP